mmetsp:Transcript_42863/g.104185  ORF Transcript_42863/g.104185 Transcript_42863/m.104185 type:complete len:305 (-) Transcript_42863:262-1176(-)
MRHHVRWLQHEVHWRPICRRGRRGVLPGESVRSAVPGVRAAAPLVRQRRDGMRGVPFRRSAGMGHSRVDRRGSGRRRICLAPLLALVARQLPGFPLHRPLDALHRHRHPPGGKVQDLLFVRPVRHPRPVDLPRGCAARLLRLDLGHGLAHVRFVSYHARQLHRSLSLPPFSASARAVCLDSAAASPRCAYRFHPQHELLQGASRRTPFSRNLDVPQASEASPSSLNQGGRQARAATEAFVPPPPRGECCATRSDSPCRRHNATLDRWRRAVLAASRALRGLLLPATDLSGPLQHVQLPGLCIGR